jgi:hypothetical protein
VNHLNNPSSKAKLFQFTSKLLSSFVKTSNKLTENQLKNVNELLLEWIGRKVEALTHFSQNTTEISILAAVIECFCEISSPNFVNYDDPRLEKAFELSSTVLSFELRSHDYFGKFFKYSENKTFDQFQFQKQHAPSLPTLHLPLSHQFLLNSACFNV